MDDRTYPRVLVINGEPFNGRSATGITMSSLFRGWPKDRLACLHLSDAPPDTSICDTNWRLTLEDSPFIRFTYSALRGFRSKGRSNGHPGGAGSPATPTPPPSSNPAPNAYSRLAKLFPNQSFADLGSYTVPAPILKAIHEFHPELVYTMLGANPILKLAIDLGVRAGLPVVSHFMDDWPSSLYRHSLLKPILKPRMNGWLRSILANPAPRLVIGPHMAEEFSRRYGGNYLPFMNAVEPSEFVKTVESVSGRDKVRLVYAGGLHLNRWKSLRTLGMVLQELQGDWCDIEVLIYTQLPESVEAQSLHLPPVMRIAGSLAPSEVSAVLREADILLHVESFDKRVQTHTRFSISTKIPQYLAAGKPIMAFGPKGLASIEYIKSIQAGVVVDSLEREALIAALKLLLDSGECRAEFGRRGLKFALENHNAETQRRFFRDMLASIA